ncbi:MAG: XRE family transcriptional regulator [Oscillospiraceae bacterium]
MEKKKLCAFGKQIKLKLVDIEQNQEWLISQVREDTGLFMDNGYLYKILTGKLKTPKIVESISKILGLDKPTE